MFTLSLLVIKISHVDLWYAMAGLGKHAKIVKGLPFPMYDVLYLFTFLSVHKASEFA